MNEPSGRSTTELLASISGGDPHAASELLPLVYEELRRLARNYDMKAVRRRLEDARGLN